jgi:hypothetical protein
MIAFSYVLPRAPVICDMQYEYVLTETPKSAIVILERNHAARATARLATARFHR